jgi:hypothetical protein
MLANYAALLNLLHRLGLYLQHSFADLAGCENEELASFPKNYTLILQRDDLIDDADLPAKKFRLLVVDYPELRRSESRPRDKVNELITRLLLYFEAMRYGFG